LITATRPDTATPSDPDAVESLAARVGVWAKTRPVRLVVLFGSRAKGDHRDDSDVDLAVWTERGIPAEERLRWFEELPGLAEHDVSLVFGGSTMDPVLGFEIVQSGKVLYERDAGLWATERARL